MKTSDFFNCCLRKLQMVVLTDCVVPAVDGEQSAACDRDRSRNAEVRQCVGRHVRDRRVGGEFEHHDYILLHLVLEHQRTLRKETLMSRREKEEDEEEKKGR